MYTTQTSPSGYIISISPKDIYLSSIIEKNDKEFDIKADYSRASSAFSASQISDKQTLFGKNELKYQYEDFLYSMPFELEGLVDKVRKSENIVSLGDNWDDEGSEGYSVGTWKAAILFLFSYAKEIHEKYQYTIDIPKIYPGHNGSIDIDWETTAYGFLVNIAKNGVVARYYADKKPSQMTEGTFNPYDFNAHLLPFAITFKK